MPDDFQNLQDGLATGAEQFPPVLVRLENILRQAIAYKEPKAKKFNEWRDFFLMAPPEPVNERVPTVATPVVRQKADGIRAHIKVSIDRTPFFTARPLSKEAADAVPAMEAIMQRALEETGSLWEIERAVDDAVIFGTGVLMLHADYDKRTVGLKHVPIRNVFVWPERASPDKLVWFRVFYSPWWEMDRLARAGVYDQDAVQAVKGTRYLSYVPTASFVDSQVGIDDELAWHQLVEAWFVGDGALQRVIFHPAKYVLLHEVDPFGGVVDRPPFFPIYIDPDHYEVWGHGIAEVVAQFQVVADVAMNAEVAAVQYKSTPPILVRANSQIHRLLQRGGSILPGQVLPYDGPDAEEAVRVLEYSVNPFNVQLLNLMNQLTEDATVSDFIVPGQPLGGRKTATEVSVTATIGQLKLQNYLRHVMRGLEEIAPWYWKLVAHVKIAGASLPGLPRGVYKTYAYSGDQGAVYMAEKTVRMVVEGTTGGSDVGLYEIYIPGAVRNDVEWKLTGNATVAEREMRLNRLTLLMNPATVQLIMAARQDPGVYHLVKRFLEALGMGYDAVAILGPEPQEPSPAGAMLGGLLQGMAGGGGENEQKPR